MPEAVIVATARSPIGRAFKGSLTQVRPDDLAATIVRAALDKVPGLDPRRHRRPDAGLRRAGGRAGRQHGPAGRGGRWASTRCRARRSTGTAHRRCRRRGWPSTRSRRARATSSSRPGSSACRTMPRSPVPVPDARSSSTPLFDEAQARTEAAAGGERDLARPARGRPAPRRLHRDGPDGREPRHAHAASRAPSRTSSACARRTWPRRPSPTASSSREITPVTTARRHRRQRATTARAPGVTWRASPA